MRVCELVLFFCVLYSAGWIAEAQEVGEAGEANFRFHEHARGCSFRRQRGFCRRRSECEKPTRQICRFGLDPVVCCLDPPPGDKAAPTTTQKPAATRKPSGETGSVKTIDLTFPGCGLRAPKIQGSTRRSGSTSRSSYNRERGLFSRGKRSPLETFLNPANAMRRRGIQPVIVGGQTAVANTWPWMVAIFKETNPRAPKRFLCGASLISQKYVLSAAHCFDGEKGNIDPSKFFVMVGAHSTKDGVEYPVQSILLHPDYKPRQYYNDISLLRLKKDAELTQKIYPVCLPSDGLRDRINVNNNNVTVTGWGDTSFGGVSSKVLQELAIPIVPLKECNESYSKLLLSNFPHGITNLFICAGVKEGGKDACQGDSGGPLVSRLKDNSWVQLGVVSFGYGCAQPGYPGVYTRVSHYSRWLYDNTDLGKA